LHFRPAPAWSCAPKSIASVCVSGFASRDAIARGAGCVEGRDRAWHWLPQLFDASILSDEATIPGQPNFTGAFVGLACQDTSGTGHHADFDWFEYRDRDFLSNLPDSSH
jgi:hypothetical protein